MGDEQRQLNEMCNSFGWRYAAYLASKTTTTTYLDTSNFIANLIDEEFALMRAELDALINGNYDVSQQVLMMTDHTFRSMISNLARMICQSVKYLKPDELIKTMLEAYDGTVVATLCKGK